MRDAPGAGGAAVGRRKAKLRASDGPADEGRTGPRHGAEAFAKGEAIRCYGTRSELDEIRRRARLVGLSASAFVRVAALNLPVRPVYDLEAARGLLALEARLERIDDRLRRLVERDGAPRDHTGAALAELRQLIAAMRALADRA